MGCLCNGGRLSGGQIGTHLLSGRDGDSQVVRLVTHVICTVATDSDEVSERGENAFGLGTNHNTSLDYLHQSDNNFKTCFANYIVVV